MNAGSGVFGMDGTLLYSVSLKSSVAPQALSLRRPFVAPDAASMIVLAGERSMFFVNPDGYLVATLSAQIRFSQPAFLDGDLYVLDGPVLLKYDTTSFSAAAPFAAPELAVCMLGHGYPRFDGKTQSWEQAMQTIYPPAGTPYPAYANVLAFDPLDALKPAVFALGADGSIRGIDTSLSNLAIGAHAVPDALEWKLYTDATGSYLCYSSQYQIVCIDPGSPSLAVTSVPSLPPMQNALAWIRTSEIAPDAGACITFPPSSIVGYAGQCVCHVDISSAGAPVITMFDCSYEDGQGYALPAIGQAMYMLTPPPYPLGAVTVSPGTPLLAPPLGSSNGTTVTYYLALDDPDDGPVLQMWQSPLVSSESLRGEWDGLFAEYPLPAINSGFMQQYFGSFRPRQASPLVTSAIAIACMQTGVSGKLA